MDLGDVCLGFRFVDLVLGVLVDFEVERVVAVVVVGSLNPVYSSHFGPMTSLMPPQISIRFALEVDLTDFSDGLEEVVPVEVIAFGRFQISNRPRVELGVTEVDDVADVVIDFPFQNLNPAVEGSDLMEVVEVVIGVVFTTVTLSNRSRLCNCLLKV